MKQLAITALIFTSIGAAQQAPLQPKRQSPVMWATKNVLTGAACFGAVIAASESPEFLVLAKLAAVGVATKVAAPKIKTIKAKL